MFDINKSAKGLSAWMAANLSIGRLRWRSLALFFGFIASAISLVVYWYSPRLLQNIDMRSRDQVFRLRTPPDPATEVAVVAVDEKSVKKVGRWPWSRSVQGDLIKKIKNLGAITVALDIIYPKPQNPLEDSILSESVDNVTGGYFFRGEKTFEMSQEGIDILMQNSISQIIFKKEASTEKIIVYPYVETNITNIAKKFSGLGFFNYIPDEDGLLRKASLVFGFQEKFYPSLSLKALSHFTGNEPILTFNREGLENIKLGDKIIPVDSRGRLPLNFYSNKGIPIISASDILDNILPAQKIKDKIVFIGVTEMGLADVRPTPVHSSFPGIGIHAVAVSNILQDYYLYQNNTTIIIDVILMSLIPFFMVWLMARLRNAWFITATFLLTIGTVWITFFLIFTNTGLLISFIYPVIAATIGGVSFQTFHVLVTQRHSRYLKQAFSTYVSPHVVEKLIKSPESFSLSGEKKIITVLFSDIRKFTTISEAVSVETMVKILNSYFGSMTEIIITKQGTLDKYIGDALMAIYNAPLDVQSHATKAAISAREMIVQLGELNKGFQAEFGIKLQIGIGIHTGEAIVGNMGSEMRFDYTAIGDTVNLASRLEGLTKLYGTTIIVSSETVKELDDELPVRRLDKIRVKGKIKPVEIFELMTDQNIENARAKADMFHKALEKYFSKAFSEALKMFKNINSAYPSDKPTEIFIKRCQKFIDGYPSEDWDGVYVAESK